MKKKLLGALLSVGAVLGLTSCMEEPHTHAFSDQWSSNENGHWHACTCDERLLDSFAAHVDADKNGSCDVCSHEVEKPHEHAFATQYSKDETGHWYDSTCDHKVTSGFAAHTEGADGVCTACGYVVTPPANIATLKAVDAVVDKVKTYYNVGETFSAEGLVVYETYSNTLSDDTLVVGDVSKYTISVKDSSGNAVSGAFAAFGNYTVTVAQGEISDSFEVRVGAKAYDSVEAALNVGIKNADKVNSGSVIVNTEFEYSILDYYFGDNYFGYVSNDLTSDYDYEYHFEKLADESIFGIQVSNYFDSDMWETIKTLSSYNEPTADNMLGVDLKSFFSYNYEVYGIEALIEALYTDATAETSQNYKESFSNYCDACGVHHGYKFSFGAYIGYYFYEVEVEFVLDAASESIKSVEIVAGQFYDESVVLDEETGVYSYAEGVTGPDSVKKLSISQNAGERNYENEYSAESFLYTSFDLEDADANAINENSVVEAGVGVTTYLYVVSATPETADPNIDSFTVTAYDAEGAESDSVFGGYEDGVISFTAYSIGNYIIKVSSTNVEKSFKLSVSYADITEFSAAVLNSYYEYEAAEEVTTEVGVDLSLGVVVNSGANEEFTVSLPEGTEGAEVAEFGGSWYFNASVAGEYVLTFTSTYDETKTATLVVTVEAQAEVIEYEAKTTIQTPYGESEATCYLTLKSNGTGSYALPDYEGTFDYEDTGRGLSFSNIENTWGDAVIFNSMKFGSVIYLSVANAETQEVIFGELQFKLAPVELELGENNVVASYSGSSFTFTSAAYENTTYVITITNGVVLEDYEPITSFKVTLGFYEEYTFEVLGEYEGADVVINIEISQGDDEEDDDDQEATDFVIGENTIECSWMGTEHTFVAAEAGVYTFQASMVDAYFMDGTSPTNKLEVTLEAGESFTFQINDNNNDGYALILISKAE